MKNTEHFQEFIRIRQETYFQHRKDPNYVHPILGHNKFTNVYRILDRTSQYELLNVIYDTNFSQDPYEVLKRIFVFNQFKTPFFWEIYKEYFPKNTSFFSDDFDYEDFLWVSQHCVVEGLENRNLFTSAYMIPPGKAGESKVKTIHERCISFQRKGSSIKSAIFDCHIERVFNTLTEIDGIGDFLASQVCFDFLWYVPWHPLYELGVGAVRGKNKLGMEEANNPRYILDKVKDLVMTSNARWITYRGIDIVPSIADCQNLLCEFDKYMRIIDPSLDKKPKRIKNRYMPGKTPFSCYIPGHFVEEPERLVTIN